MRRSTPIPALETRRPEGPHESCADHAAPPARREGSGRRPGGDAGGGPGRGGAVKVGLGVPQSGVYATVGNEIKHGWELWLEQHGGKLGSREVTTVVADEGEAPQTGVPAVQKLLQGDQVDAIVGIISSAIALGAKDVVAEARKLMIVANAGAGKITGEARSPYIWRTSFTNAQVASVMGKHLA